MLVAAELLHRPQIQMYMAFISNDNFYIKFLNTQENAPRKSFWKGNDV